MDRKTRLVNWTLVGLLLFSAWLFTTESKSYYCDCKKEHCIPLPTCHAGVLKDVCDCCDVCAKAEGDSCGGIYNHAGSCGSGLKCQPPIRFKQLPGKCIATDASTPLAPKVI